MEKQVSEDNSPLHLQSKMTSDESPLTKSSDKEPEDVGGTVYLYFLVWGIAILLPWNAICSIFDFFEDEVSNINLIAAN